MLDGWISIHRKLQDHWIWKNNEVFDKRSAWIDLLLLVNHYNEKIYFEGKLLEVERGQKIISVDKLAKRWKWSRHKVTDFLDRLEKDGMIVRISDSKRTLISIENYEKYQFTKNDEKMKDSTLKAESTEMNSESEDGQKKWDMSGTQKGQVFGHQKGHKKDTTLALESLETKGEEGTGKKNGTQKGQQKGQQLGQKWDTNNNITNISLFNLLIKKYNENPPANFKEKIIKIGEIKKSTEFNQLSFGDQDKLFNKLMSLKSERWR